MPHEAFYRVVDGPTAWDLESKVKDLLREGWAPQGGVAAVPTGDGGVRLFQALVRDTKLTPPPIAVAQVAIPVGETPPL